MDLNFTSKLIGALKIKVFPPNLDPAKLLLVRKVKGQNIHSQEFPFPTGNPSHEPTISYLTHRC